MQGGYFGLVTLQCSTCSAEVLTSHAEHMDFRRSQPNSLIIPKKGDIIIMLELKVNEECVGEPKGKKARLLKGSVPRLRPQRRTCKSGNSRL